MRVIEVLAPTTEETVFGVAIKVDGSCRYCKYPTNHQSYKTKKDAIKGAEDVLRSLENGAILYYPFNKSRGINKHEPVRILLPKNKKHEKGKR